MPENIFQHLPDLLLSLTATATNRLLPLELKAQNQNQVCPELSEAFMSVGCVANKINAHTVPRQS